MIKLANGNWLAVAAIYDNNGYTKVSWGGTRLQVFLSTDNCRTWSLAATFWEDGRELDNGQFAQLANGDILLAMRSVRWQESYQLKVYKSMNGGSNWSYLSTIDEKTGSPGTLGNPDKGVYEDKSILTPYPSKRNYTLEGDIKLNNAGQGSLIFNVTNPATGTDSLKGYAAGIDSAGQVWLGRFNNNWTQLGLVNTTISTNTWYHMKVVVNEGNTKVYVGDMATPKITFTDTTFVSGTIGVRGGFGNSVSFDNITIN
ncbi:family 16 glycoside hydrolase [Paenibacillus sp. Soil750]|uniref:family 16 glycoside hydrolase n=1 Tax=Paenibacillus sp. Soil750 TaxID=1736398 RepID=UPI0006FC5BC7|nr:family 16 glycoside hydrolase [Paenibacillus sp. Soil750]KRE69861.1 hypothetical protein ASL11_16000 [Paenibacillus sp. Soil750]